MPPNQAKNLFDEGLVLFNKGEYTKASKFFQDAVMEEPEFHEALYNLACCFSMMEDTDNALVYLSRASQLNPICLEWAKKDKEMDNIRQHSLFQKIINREHEDSQPEVEQPPPSEEDDFHEMTFEKIEDDKGEDQQKDIPKFDDGKSKPVEISAEYYPPCIRCEGLIDKEMRPRYDPKITFGIILVGMIITLSMIISFWGLLGIPTIAFGLFLVVQADEVWVCQNCGAVGKECGQPDKKNKIVKATADAEEKKQ